MNRRDYLSLTGVLVGSSAVGSNLLSRKAMAITYNLDTNLSFDYVENPQIVAKFSYFKLDTTRIDTSKPVNIKLKSGLNDGDVEIRDSKEYSNILNLDEYTHNIETNLNENPLDITADSDFKNSIIEQYDESGGSFELKIQLIVECDGVFTETNTENINMYIQENKIIKPNGGISRYKFEDNTDTNIIKDVWSGVNGTIEGTTYTSDSVEENYAMLFDGNGYVNLGQQSEHEFDAGESFSLSWWRKSSDTGNGAYIANSYSNVDIDEQRPWYLARPKDNAEFYLRDTNNNDYQVQGPNISDNNWHMQTGVYDASSAEIRLYIDGIHEDTVGGVAEEPYGTNGGLGEHNGDWLYALMDDLRIYNKALSSTEIENLYNNGSIIG